MPKLLAIALLALALMLAACGAKLYRVTTYGGEVYTSKGEPHFDEERKVYRLRLPDGKHVIVPQKDVKEIRQES